VPPLRTHKTAPRANAHGQFDSVDRHAPHSNKQQQPETPSTGASNIQRRPGSTARPPKTPMPVPPWTADWTREASSQVAHAPKQRHAALGRPARSKAHSAQPRPLSPPRHPATAAAAAAARPSSSSRPASEQQPPLSSLSSLSSLSWLAGSTDDRQLPPKPAVPTQPAAALGCPELPAIVVCVGTSKWGGSIPHTQMAFC